MSEAEAPESPSAVNGTVDPEEVGKKLAKKRGKETPTAETPPEPPAEPARVPANCIFNEFWGL
jgi:hypothetical protein